jgi:uncharacterized protein
MLIGMALYQCGLFSAALPTTRYLRLLALTLVVGLPLDLAGVYFREMVAWSGEYVTNRGRQFNYWASLPLALAWVCGVMLACQRPGARRYTAPFAAVGRTALSNYLLQSLICTTLFYGHGFGLFGHVERTGQLALVVLVWVIQLIASAVWLLFFCMGPAEWLWRALTYLHLPAVFRPRTHQENELCVSHTSGIDRT